MILRLLAFLSPAFSSPGARAPAPAPAPVDNSAELERQRVDAERAAVAERASAGRRATVAGGMAIAAEDQLARGKEGAARRALLG